MKGAILLLPPVAFGVFLALACLLLLWGRVMAPGRRPTPEKVEPYACGEALSWGPLQLGYSQFFAVAVLFTVLHVAVLVVATMPGGPAALFAVAYLVVMLFAAAALLGELKTI
ncbi:MAG: NADH-quinone oxidoreductase subunit A [Acetobacteraceae bacterium]|nr:NADH-quinone oxidoreductase subunit A [Acetobacteraceae bacterium]